MGSLWGSESVVEREHSRKERGGGEKQTNKVKSPTRKTDVWGTPIHPPFYVRATAYQSER